MLSHTSWQRFIKAINKILFLALRGGCPIPTPDHPRTPQSEESNEATPQDRSQIRLHCHRLWRWQSQGLGLSPAVAEAIDPPGSPGAAATWTKGDKEGVGTSLSPASKVWYTLTEGTMSEVYYPRADTPNTRELYGIRRRDGTTAQRESEQGTRTVELADPKSLSYRQTTTDDAGRWRLTKTYVTDPQRSSVMLGVTFRGARRRHVPIVRPLGPLAGGNLRGRLRQHCPRRTPRLGPRGQRHTRGHRAGFLRGLRCHGLTAM